MCRPPAATGARCSYRPSVRSAAVLKPPALGRAPRPAVTAVLVSSWGLALVVVVLVGRTLEARGQLHLGAAPLSGRVRDDVPWAGLLLAAGTAAALVALGPRLAPRLGPVALPCATAVGAAAWAVALALVDGPASLAAPLTSPHDYLADVGRVEGGSSFLPTFAGQVVQREGVEAWRTHVAGHPPGALLLFWWTAQVGLGGPAWAAALLLTAGSSAATAVVVAVRALAGPAAAAAAAPLLVLAPYVLWVVTSADAAFLAVSAWGAALLALAVTRRPGGTATAAALAGGVLLGSGLYLSYGLVPFGAVAGAMLLAGGLARARRATVVAAAGVLVVAAAYTAAGFWWPDGYAATRIRWAQGVGSDRPFLYSAVANLAVAGLATGPAVVAALSRLRTLPGRLGLPVVGALITVLLAEASGMSRGEVERIWLPFFPWLLVGAVVLARGGAVPRRWLVAQAACALAVTALVRTSW